MRATPRRNLVLSLFATAVAVLLGVAYVKAGSGSSSPSAGQKAPAFQTKTVDGKAVKGRK